MITISDGHYTLSQKKTSTFLFFIWLCQKLNDFNFLCVLNPEKIDISSLYICPPHLYNVATLPSEIIEVVFQQYYSYILQIIYVISEENKLLPSTETRKDGWE